VKIAAEVCQDLRRLGIQSKQPKPLKSNHSQIASERVAFKLLAENPIYFAMNTGSIPELSFEAYLSKAIWQDSISSSLQRGALRPAIRLRISID
jgi:hypothetical protein